MRINLRAEFFYFGTALNFCLLAFPRLVSARVYPLNSLNYENSTESADFAIINFYASWCRFSQNLEPQFKNASDQFENDEHVLFGSVDCDADADLAKKNSISKYPTIKYFIFGHLAKKEYRGSRHAMDIADFVRNSMKTAFLRVESMAELEKIDKSSRTIIAYLPDESCTEFKDLHKIAVILRDDCKFYLGIGPAFDEEMKHGSTVAFRKNEDGAMNELRLSGAVLKNFAYLKEWITDKCVPLVREITFGNAEELTEEGLPFLILFRDSKDVDILDKFTHQVATELMDERKTINFLHADGHKFAHPLHHLGKSLSDLPLIAIDSFRHMYLLPDIKKMSQPGSLKQFIADLHSGKLHREMHYGADPTEICMKMSVEEHRRKFKNLGKSEELRRRRAEGSVELRKTRKDDQLMKRRNIESTDPLESSDVGDISGGESMEKMEIRAPKISLPLEECMEVFRKNEAARFLDAIESIRRSLSRQTEPSIDAVISVGAVPYLVKCLTVKDEKIQFEATWALTNISSGTTEQTNVVVRSGAVSPLIGLMDCEPHAVAEQACWALSNIAGDCAEMRDIVINAGIVDPLIRMSDKHLSVQFMRVIAWTFSNLCRHRNPAPPNDAVHKLLPICASLLTYTDESVLTDVCWAIAYLSDGTDERIDLVIQHGVVPRMVLLISASTISHIAPALRCLGNIVTGNDEQTQVVVDSGVLEIFLPSVLRIGKNAIIKEAMWMLSNIAAGTQSQIQAIVDANLVPVLIEVIKKCDHKSQQEALWAISNLIHGGSADQIDYLLTFAESIFSVLCDSLKSREVKMISLCLDSISNLLAAAKKIGQLTKCTTIIEECGGLDKIEALQSHSNEDIYHKVFSIIEVYFGSDESDEVRMDQLHKSQLGEKNFDDDQVPDGGFIF